MTIGSAFFILCSIACLVGALTTALARNPIRSALGLLLTILGIAGFYLALSAQFLAAIQLIVYAGTVVVLYVFVLMLLGADAADRVTPTRTTVARVAGAAGIVAAISTLMYRSVEAYSKTAASGKFPLVAEDFGSVKAVGTHLFSQALVPFELSTALLIVAVIGAIAVARSGGKKSPTSQSRPTNPHAFFGGPVEPRHPTAPVAKEPTP